MREIGRSFPAPGPLVIAMDGRPLHFGCGLDAPEGWENFDSSPSLRLQRLPAAGSLVRRATVEFPSGVQYGDIVLGLPVPPRCARAIYCSHVLEHLALDDFRRAIRNTYGYLREGGIFRLVLPDLRAMADEYVRSVDPEASIRFMDNTLMGHRTRARGVSAFLRSWFGNSRHLWMWDYRGLEHELGVAGFTSIRRASFGDSSEPRFADVESRERWEGTVGVECRR